MNHHTQLNIFFHDPSNKKKNKGEGRIILLGLTSFVADGIILCTTSNTAHESAEFGGVYSGYIYGLWKWVPRSEWRLVYLCDFRQVPSTQDL